MNKLQKRQAKRFSKKRKKITSQQGQGSRGFAPTETARFTAEVVKRCAITGDEEPVLLYSFRVEKPKGYKQCPRGECPDSVAYSNAVAAVHIKIHDFLFKETHPSPFIYDAYLWQETNEGRPIAILSTSAFEGSRKEAVLPIKEDRLSPEHYEQIKAKVTTEMGKKL